MEQPELIPEPQAGALDFSEPLTQKYQPHTIASFVGMPKQKALFSALLMRPRPCALLLVGPPGVGKTTMPLAFAQQLGGSLIQIASQKCTVETVEKAWETVHYYPSQGNWWVVLADEADKMSYAAQIALLSKLDSVSTLKPVFGGGVEKSKPLPVIWIFTCNGRGEDGTEPPSTLEPRFLSRCLKIEFKLSDVNGELPDFLRAIWDKETDTPEDGPPNFERMVADASNCVRDALQALELAILAAGSWPALALPEATLPLEPLQKDAHVTLQTIAGLSLDPQHGEITAQIVPSIVLKHALAYVERLHWTKAINLATANGACKIIERAIKECL